MKKIISLPFVLFVLMLASCDKNTEMSTSTESQREKILKKAKDFSKKHDVLVSEMIAFDNALLLKRNQSNVILEPQEKIEHMLDVIFKTTGVKPEISDRQSMKVSAAMSGDDPDYYWVNLDVEEMLLAPYAASEASLQYLGSVDDIIQNSSTGLDEKLAQLQLITDEVMIDQTIAITEAERVLTAVEVMKGSLVLWSEFQQKDSQASFAPGIMKASIRNWGFFKKLGFVAAADAIGGVLGFFLGGYIVVNGVPIYLPAGGTGMVLSAAALSYIAASAVGW